MTGDKKKIMELAKAAAFVRKAIDAPHDSFRLKLIQVKPLAKAKLRKLTLRQIAKRVYPPEQFERCSTDYFAALRKECKRMKIPFAAASHVSYMRKPKRPERESGKKRKYSSK